MNVRLNEILTPELLTEHAQHIREFLLLEGITPATESRRYVVIRTAHQRAY
jgi:hypothetical protein